MTSAFDLILLAGGAGLRMENTDKGLAQLDGEPLLAHLLKRLPPWSGKLIISANRNLDIYRQWTADVVQDARPGFSGPLAGLEAALIKASQPRCVVLPCDMPFLPAALPAALADAVSHEGDIAVARDPQRLQPLCMALYGNLQPDLANYLDSGRRSVLGWLDSKPFKEVTLASDSHCWVNINTHGELIDAANTGP